jgi:uncharacterized membrane protein
LPAPADLAAYEHVRPGAADRIIRMAEQSNEVRNESLRAATKAEIAYHGRGQIYAFLITLVAMVASIAFFAFGNNVAGGVLLGVPVVVLVRSFLGQRSDD